MSIRGISPVELVCGITHHGECHVYRHEGRQSAERDLACLKSVSVTLFQTTTIRESSSGVQSLSRSAYADRQSLHCKDQACTPETRSAYSQQANSKYSSLHFLCYQNKSNNLFTDIRSIPSDKGTNSIGKAESPTGLRANGSSVHRSLKKSETVEVYFHLSHDDREHSACEQGWQQKRND